MQVGYGKTAKWSDILVETPEDPRNLVLDGGPHPPRQGAEGSMQLLQNYFGHLF